MSHNLKPGDKVTYIPSYAKDDPELWDRGIVKSLNDDLHVFVVYNCNGQWDKYKNYTAARTPVKNLVRSWSGKTLVKENNKWRIVKGIK